MPDANGKPSGFSHDPVNPFNSPATTPSRIGPFFEFDPGRMSTTPTVTADVYKYYPPGLTNDSGHQYVYFQAQTGDTQPYREYFINDGSSNYTIKSIITPTTIVRPYWDQRNMTWINPESFQILCCGLDGRFGQENVYPTGILPDWDTKLPSGTPSAVKDDLKNTTNVSGIPLGNFDHMDDQTNFCSGTIGDDLP
jgi:hypothetical protein